jgi:uncharacterized protein YbjT (DUF2867 family)
MPTIAVVGATGNIGHELATKLLSAGTRVRAVGRSADRLAALEARGAEPWVGSLSDVKFLSAAFRTTDGVFAMIPPAPDHPDPKAYQRQTAENMAAAAQVARVRHVVTLSSIGADQPAGTGPIAGLHGMEQRFEQIPGLNLIHLRPAYFMENHVAAIGLIRAAGIFGAMFAPDLPVSMIATRDIAAAAAQLLARPGFAGRAIRELQGPRDYTMREATRILGSAIGRPDLPYVQFGESDTRQALTAAGFSPALAELYVEMLNGFNSGLIRAREPRSGETTTPTTLEEFAAAVFAPAFSR